MYAKELHRILKRELDPWMKDHGFRPISKSRTASWYKPHNGRYFVMTPYLSFNNSYGPGDVQNLRFEVSYPEQPVSGPGGEFVPEALSPEQCGSYAELLYAIQQRIKPEGFVEADKPFRANPGAEAYQANLLLNYTHWAREGRVQWFEIQIEEDVVALVEFLKEVLPEVFERTRPGLI